MTTAAYDGNTIAADGRVTSSSIILTDKHLKIREYGDVVVVTAGDYSSAKKWEDKKFGPAQFDDEDDDTRDNSTKSSGDFIALVVEKETGIPYLSYGGEELLEVEFPVAIGSGAEYAKSAMHFGKTAVEAVKFAMKFDAATGGKITKVDL